jgi:ferrous iron transport protein A
MPSLDNIKENTVYTVESVSAPPALLARLKELGLINGTEIKRVMSAPSGNPVSYLIRGAQIAIRNEYAKNITVNKAEL